MSLKDKQKGINFPHVYIMFMLVMLLVVILSWIVPSGEYERIVNPDTGITRT
ncbi:YfcC family protein OS=Lysinibacillus sphaericus OX=1421 GN=LS41612_14495 PE=4 SV=1 [Lysinibacillus sphaericus]